MPILGALFAIFTIIASLGIGNTVQVNSIVDGLHYIIPITKQYNLLIGMILTVLVGVVIIGGVKRIAQVASIVVPFMALTYCGTALLILILHVTKIPSAFGEIFRLAFTPHAIGGGTMGSAIRYGVARGVFSNEAGLGSASIAHAAAKTDNAVKQGLVAMLGPFIDTIIICSMTALVIVIAGHDRLHDLTGATLSAYAFENGLHMVGFTSTHLGPWVVGLSLIFFAYTTIIAWSYYADRSVEYLFGTRLVMPYRILFTLLITVGAIAPLHFVWEFADLANLMMAIPNLIGVLLLAGSVKKLCDSHFSKAP